ncbi:TonB-dependent receptor [Thermochromatium tepidum]|uniref:TonB-dependent receptor n=1 Tax=Thermochromatium tepidum ATCC 43061 TaxID=316276 RepID=A0A6I6E5J6_THETI|nr:TonB-dependent receptor [Thermochromatium tepidum]QGU31728.1 TonB-dependent receptor [Thermochromatium tepidum ATCC 43061]
MRPSILTAGLATALIAPAAAVQASSEAEIAQLRSMLEQMRSQYERRIQDLEDRLARAERQSRPPSASAASAATDPAISQPMRAPSVSTSSIPASTTSHPPDFRGALSSGTAFNPQISVILNGNYYNDGRRGSGAALVGQALQPSGGLAHDQDHVHEADHGHSHGGLNNGFNFSEAELSFSATVDPYFDAAAYLAVMDEGDVHLEEAWLQTRALPHGLRVKAGKFLSDFGYANKQHPHAWDFVDQNLPYLNLLGDHGLQDTGVQLTWLPRLPVYTLLGVEALQGDQERFGATLSNEDQERLGLDATKNGPRLWTLFAKVAPDLGQDQALQVGVSYAHNTQHQEVQTHTHADEDEIHENALAGEADLWGLDLVYKYDGSGPHGQGDFKFQTEYLRSVKDLDIVSSPHPEIIGSRRTFTTDGFYAQALYGIAPRWTAGVRYDMLGLTNEVGGGEHADYGSSDRWSLNLTWKLSEFSQLRAQYARNDILVAANERERFDAFYLQFLMSLGSHGAHAF